MKTGDTFCDTQERSYKVGLLLGRGLWGETFRVQRIDDEGDYVLKCSLSAGQLSSAAAPTELAEACQSILVEQGEFLAQGAYDFLPNLLETIELEDGRKALLLERYPSNLELRLQSDVTFLDVLELLLQAAKQCQQLRDGPGVHGALRPGNILIGHDGAVHLSDVVTPALRRSLPQLLEASPGLTHYLPPEVSGATREAPFAPVCDTFALGLLLWRSVLGNQQLPELPESGPDKAALVALKDRLHARVKQEDSNPRFHARLAERLSATVSRAISTKASPSPPYRFDRVDEFLPRLLELRSLVRPEVDTVGRVLLDRPASTTHFTTDEKIRFSISIGCSPGVERHKEVACGIAVFDRDSGERVREVPSTFDVNRHPSGRFRFQFELGELPPGNFRVRAAFAIRDSGQEPNTVEAEIEVRAAHGYIPPPEQPPTGALRMESHLQEPRTVTEPMAELPMDPPGSPHSPPPPAPAPPAPALPPAAPAHLPKPAPIPKPALASPPEPKPMSAPRPATRTADIAVQATDERELVTRRTARSTVSFSGDTVPVSSGNTAVPIEEPPPSRPSVEPRPKPQVAVPEPRVAAPKPAPTPGVAATIPVPRPKPAVKPAPKPAVQPEPKAPSGSWADLPLGGVIGDDITELGDEPEDLDEYRPKPAWLQLVEMIRGDSWAMFMAGAAVIATILLVILFLLRV
jgi:serine/threonine protein kinase